MFKRGLFTADTYPVQSLVPLFTIGAADRRIGQQWIDWLQAPVGTLKGFSSQDMFVCSCLLYSSNIVHHSMRPRVPEGIWSFWKLRCMLQIVHCSAVTAPAPRLCCVRVVRTNYCISPAECIWEVNLKGKRGAYCIFHAVNSTRKFPGRLPCCYRSQQGLRPQTVFESVFVTVVISLHCIGCSSCHYQLWQVITKCIFYIQNEWGEKLVSYY